MKPHPEQIHNAVRHTFYFEERRLQQFARAASQKKPLERSIYAGLIIIGELLRITESFESTSWNSAEEASETMQYFAEALVETGLPAHIFFPKGNHKPTSEEIRGVWGDLQKKLHAALREAAHIATLPYRRTLEQAEWIALYERFEARFNHGKSLFQMDNAKYRFHPDIQDYADNVFEDIKDDITNSAETLYLLNYWTYEYSYELSGKWFVEMNENYGGYWIDKTFEHWYCRDGMGFLAYGF
ncbi:MAG: hypothetical protein ACOVSW_16395 [Candidatus Kapaibacteriota bacterium]